MVRFDKPCLRVSGAVEYFCEHMEIGDYLEQGGKAELTWVGKGAEMLGLQDRCRLDHFERLCEGRHPLTGERLTARDKGAARRVCFFGQISPPKDVSIACLVGGDERIRGWWDKAVRETLQEMEAVTATRHRRGGSAADRPTGNMVAAIVTHEASRKLDPQLHTHVCIFNATFDPSEKRWKCVQPSGYYRHQAFFREVCYSHLARRMSAAGYELELVRDLGFNLKGIPPELRERFSRRRAEIKRLAAAQGVSSQDALQTIAGDSRDAKVDATAADLRAGWLKTAGDKLSGLRDMVAGADGRPKPQSKLTPCDALSGAASHLFERRSVVDQRELLAEALAIGGGDSSVAQLRDELERHLASGEFFRSGDQVGSRDALQAEEEVVSWAIRTRCDCPPLGGMPSQSASGADQQAAVAVVLASRARVTILQGDAGTGKTTCLKAIVAGIEQAGGRVFGCAPSSGAAYVLRRELTPHADTLQQLLVNASLQLRVRGCALIVDEAGLVSVRQMRDLCRIAHAQDCRLLLVGDTKQHTSVEAGDALRCLQRYASVPTARLTRIHRQKDPALRRAVRLLARGEIAAAFDSFRRLGAVHEVSSSRSLLASAADDYLRTLRSRRTCLAIAPVWSDIHAFNAEVRARLRASGVLRSSDRSVPSIVPLQWTRAQCRQAANYHPGDVLTFYRATAGFARDEHATVAARDGDRLVLRRASGAEVAFDPRRADGFDVGLPRKMPVAIGDRLMLRASARSAGLKNGDIVEVSGFGSDGSLRLAGGGTLPPGFRHFTHGYATTSHGSQGRTVARGILILTEDGLRAANMKQCYVSNSRFRESQAIYTTDAKAARAAMQGSADRLLASELRETIESSSFRTSWLHLLLRTRRFAPALTALRGWRDSFATTLRPVSVRS